MSKSKKNVTKLLFSVIITTILLLAGSCQNWMSSDDFMSKIEREVHDANAPEVKVYVRYANSPAMGTTEPSGNITMKVDVASKITAVTGDDYGFVKWAAFSTNDFPTTKNHPSLVFITEDDYNEKYKEKELPESVITFATPNNPTTELKILTSRSDIFIMPIVAARPAYQQSVPANADSNIVKNTSIRILFSKPIDEKTLYDDEGKLNYSITTSTSVFSDDDSEMETKDITDLFEHELSSSKKMLTLKLKTERDENGVIIKQELLDNRQRITVTLLEGLCDLYGYTMNGNYTFSFQTGTNTDSLAPMIEVIYGGIGDICDVFVTFGEDYASKGTATTAAKTASKTNVNSAEYDDVLVAQRVHDKLNIFVKANDIIASGNADINPAKDLSEDNVATIGISASLYYDKNGNPITINKDNSEEFTIGKKNYIYISGSIDKDAEINKLFTEVAPLDKDGNQYTGGTVYTYDVSNLPDGLIRIDVWAIDMTGNSGGEFDKGAPYYEKHDNGFKSIFVVKDTTPIDSKVVKENKKVVSNSAEAPYYWYNHDTLSTMRLFDTESNKITDYGHIRLRSLDKNLYWYFGVGDESNLAPESVTKWVRIHDATTGESIPFPLTNAIAPSKDGPVDITLFLKDDLGNVSIPVTLDSIMYDNTKPTVTLLNDYGDFVKADGSKDLHASKEKIISQILKVSFTEPNIDESGSGIRRMDIHVTKDGQEVEVPLSNDPSNLFKVKWTTKTGDAANPADAKEIKIAVDDKASTNNLKVFDVTDSSKITTGTLFIYGITLGDADGDYKVTVDLYDSAMNKTPETAMTLIAHDTTDPKIEKIKVIDAMPRLVYGDTSATKTWWLPKEKFVGGNLSAVSFQITVDEYGSGLEVLKVSEDVEFTAQTKLKLGDVNSLKYLVPEIDYKLNVAAHTITLLNNYNVLLKGKSTAPIVFTLENVKLNKINAANGNKVALEVEDFVHNKKINYAENSTEDYKIYYDETTYGTLIYADDKNPEIATLKIEDSAQNSETNPDAKKYDRANYTNSHVVALILTLKADAPNVTDGSGVKTITLSDNAEFTDNTRIIVDDSAAPLNSSDYDFAGDKKSVTFHKVFTEANTIRFENVKILSEAEGLQTVKADLTDFTGLETLERKESLEITYDSVAPVINDDGINWIPDNSLVSFGNTKTTNITDQSLKVDFTEETAGVNVIRFDIEYEGDSEGSPSYAEPFASHDFNLYYDNSQINFQKSDGHYLLLDETRKSGSFTFDNLKIGGTDREGKYNIKITLLDAAENKNPQDGAAVYSKEIFMDTTAPLVKAVHVLAAKPRTVYGDSAQTTTWWMPYEKFDENKDLTKVDLLIKVDEIGTGLKYIKLSEDVEFTEDSKLFSGTKELVKGTDYTLDTVNKVITLLNHRSPILKGNSNAPQTEFTLKNVKFKQINTTAGNKAALTVNDFVDNVGTNELENSSPKDYKVYYDTTSNTGTLVYADNTPPAIASINIEDTAQNTNTNPDNQAYDADNYTNTQDVILTLTLAADAPNLTDGSGVKTIHLTDNAEFTNETRIYVDNSATPLNENVYHFASDKKSVDFDNVFTAANTIKFTNVHIVDNTEGSQIIKADLTDFAGIKTITSKATKAITYDSVNPVINSIIWNAPDSLTAIGKVKTNEVTDQTLTVNFTEATAGTKVIRFDVEYENDPQGSASYATPFSMSNFKLKYNDTELDNTTDYQISEGRYIILTNPKNSGTFKFDNLKLRKAVDEGEYAIKITLLDAAENKNTQGTGSVYSKSIFMDTTAPVITKLAVLDAIPRVVYGQSTTSWWMPYSKFSEGTLSKVSLKINVDEAGSGLKFLDLSHDVEFTETTKLKVGNAGSYTYLTKGTDYTLDVTNNRITLLNHESPKLKGTSSAPATEFILENVKLNKINTSEGNKVALTVTDFVNRDGTNQGATAEEYTVYYGTTTSTGTRLYADDTRPEITFLKTEDSAQDSTANPDAIAYDGPHYTNDNKVILTLKLAAESATDGSGVKTVRLSDNAVFSSDTTITVVDTANSSNNMLLSSSEYNFAEDYKSVTFAKVFTADNVLKFTNVKIISQTPGNQIIKADLTDLAGLTTETSASTNNIILDKTAPSVGSIAWVTDNSNVTTGSERDVTVDTQALKIDFTEATAGVKVIKFDIHLEDSNSFAEPFSASNFALKYNGTALVKNTDYTLDTNKRYIILTEPKNSGSFIFENLKLNATEQAGTYNVDVTMLDAAENKIAASIAMDIDSTVPVITGELEIPDLIKAYKLTTSGISSTAEYWLPLTYVNGSAQAPNSIPVYITIEENGSGIKVITFAEDVTLSTTLTKLYMVAADGTETEVEASKYTINPTNKTITINQASQALNKNQTNLEFKILVKGLGFANADTSDAASVNKVSVKVSDVAMNTSNILSKVQGVPAGQSIYSDSLVPAIPLNFKLKDRSSTTQDNDPSQVAASEDYTNESIVNMEFGLDGSETYGSGYHKFEIAGAAFTDSTAVTMKTTSGNNTIQGIAFELSNDKRTLTLKTSGEESKALVIRDAVNVTITNVQLENAQNGDKKVVNLNAYDLVGRKHSVPASDYIFFDNVAPVLDKLFAANYANKVSHYVPSVNVYPHANDENATGVPVTYGSVADVPTFYTATYYENTSKVGNSLYTLYTYKGQVSRSSTYLYQDFTYGAVLGVHASDNVQLGGSVSSKTFFHYVEDTNFTQTAAQIINTSSSSRTNPASDIQGNTTTGKDTSLWFGIPAGKYSAVIVDEAGNVSDVIRFAVVKDIEKPSTTNLNDRVLFARPGEDYNVYRNTAAAPSDGSAFEHGFKGYNSSSSGVNGGGIRTKKFVTKEASDKRYKIILKLGQDYDASNLITNMQGASVSSSISTSKYADLNGTSSSAPIEQYLISTWYGEWPSSYQSQDSHGYSYAYKPLVPKYTTFPSGQTLDTGTNLSTTNYQDVRNYFGYSADFTSSMRILDNGSANPYASWHSYSHSQGSDGTKYTDYGNSITSYVDSNDNLVIELPPKSTAPVSVFLRDGCGNMTYVVCGLQTGIQGSYTWYEETDTEHDNPHNVSYTYQVAPSFIIDNWLGWKQTTNGVNMKPILRQNPHMLHSSVNANEVNVKWPSFTGTTGYHWSNNSGNGYESQGGEGESFGHIRDHVKKATYYNPKISATSQNITANKFKLGLTLYFTEDSEDGTGSTVVHPEDILFDSGLGKTDSTTDYSTRALLYCTQSPERPEYDDIVKSNRYDQVQYGDTGFRTDWTAIRISSTSTSAVTLLLDYPEPDYDALGWVVNDPVTHEPIPHYMWYIYEDRVGNYEIGKVVNSYETDRDVLAGTKASTTVYDKWLFDGKKPILAINGTITSTNKNGTSPDSIGSSQDSVDSLVATNNGYVPYLSGSSTVYVRVTDGSSLRHNSLKNSTTGYGTTHVVEDATNQRINEPFMNLEVSEITGIRGFAWSNSSTPPALSYEDMSGTGNTHGDQGRWYAGYKATAQYADIGCPFYYGYTNANGTAGSGNAANSYFSFTDSSSSYKGVYSGTKVNTVIPKAMLSESSSKDLWLHVVDWTGNVASYRMGSSLVFKNDITGPAWNKNQAAYSEDEHYEVTDDLKITIAGNEAGSAARHETMKVRMPTNYFTETGSGFAGFKFGNSTALTVNNVTKDDTGTYIEIPYDVYKDWPIDGKKPNSTDDNLVEFYCFDNVGNAYDASSSSNGRTCLFTGVYDTLSPAYDTVSFVTKAGEGTEFIHTSTSTDEIKTVSGYGKVTNFTPKTGTTKITTAADLDAAVTAGKVQEVWVNKLNTSRFHINLTSSISDFRDAVIKKWDGSAWSTEWSWNTNTSDRNTSDATSTIFCPNSYNLLNFNSNGTYYQIDTSDKAGNHSYQYFKLYLDNQGPTIVARTDATTDSSTATIALGKGSIGKITSEGTYYYTADSSYKATIKFAMTDDNAIGTGIKNSAQKLYYRFDDNTNWTEIPSPTDGITDITAYVASGDLDKIYLKDILGNPRTVDVSFKYDYTNGSETISKLTYLNTKPAKPTFKVYANDATISTTENLSGNGDWSLWNTSLAADSTDTIAINGKSLKHLKISFTKSDKIIGYLVTDGAGNQIKEAEYGTAQQYGKTVYVQNIKNTYLSDEYKTDAGSYSFKTDLKDTFTETLPLLINNGVNTSYAQAVRKYYAVDVVGNISDPLTLTYTYSNPTHQATDIHLIKSLDEIEDSDVKATITAAVNNGTLKLAQIADSVVGTRTTRYFNGDYLLLSCTLKEKASSSNNDTPARIELVDIWGGAYPGSAVRGYAEGDNIIIYPSNSKNNDNRYYCYVAFKVGNDYGSGNNKVWSHDVFDNNDQYGGSQLYLRVYGKATGGNEKGTESDSYLLNPASEIDIRWKRDTSAPVIKDTYIDDNRLKGYQASGNVTIGYDNQTWTNGKTNYYSRDMYIYLPVADITDGFTYTGDNNNDIGLKTNDFITYAGMAQYKTIVTVGASEVDSGWTNIEQETIGDESCYKIAMPNVETVHSEITLKIRDAVGNESSGIRIGKSDYVDSLWWLVDDLLTKTGAQTTITAPTVEWPNPTDLTGYTFDVTPPVGSIITSITAKLPGSDTNLVSDISFKEYKSQPTMNGSNGWINISGLEVTLNKIAQTWSPQDVVFTINGVAENSTVTETVLGFVPAKKISSTDLSLAPATWNSAGTAETVYDVGITMNGGDNAPSIDKLEGMTFDAYLGDTKMTNIAVSFDKNNSKFTIKGEGIPRVKTWANQVIKIKISGSNIVDGGITLDAMTISPISAGDIGIKQLATINNVETETDINWNQAAVDGTGERTFKLKFKCPTSIPEGTTISTNDVGTISSFDVDNQTAIFKVYKKWDSQTLNISIGDTVKEGLLTVPALDANDITISSSPAGWASTTTNNEYTLTVSVKGDVTLAASDFSATNATISTAWNASTSTLKIKPTTQSWTAAQDVVVTVHNVDTPSILTVPRRELVDGDITLGTPSYSSTNKRYEMAVTKNNGVTKENLASVSAINATTNEQIIDTNNIRFNSDKSKIYFYSSKLPAKLWNQQQLINLTITASNGSSITKASGLTVEAIAADDITIQFVKNGTPENLANNTWWAIGDDARNGNGEKVFPLKITAPAALPDGCVVKYGEQTLSFDAEDHSIVLLPLKEKVQQQTVALTINGITKTTVMTVPARNLAAGDITVSTATWSETATSYELTISYFNGASKTNINSIAAANNDATVTLDNDKTKVTLTNVSKGWSQKDIKLTLNGSIDLGAVLTGVSAKVPAEYITVTPTNPTAWAAGKTSVTFKVSSSDNTLSITKVLFGETELNNSNNAYTITAAQDQTIAEDVTITIKTKHDDVETDVTKRIFPISGTENRFFGRAISINGMQEVYTFAETPKSVAAMQTRIIELPAVVQKAWETFTEEKEEVAAALAPASQVVEPKKSSKKANKKAAKKVVEAVTETAAALEVTELPVELLEEPKADDQLAMILPKTANTEETELVEPQASVSADAVDVSVTEAEPVSEKHSSAAIWVVLLAVLSSVAGLIFLKKRKVSV